MHADEEAAAIEARIAAAGFTLFADDGPPPGVEHRWLAGAVPTDSASPGSTDHAATGATRLEALRELENRVFG